MIHGIGIDLIEIERIQHVLERQPKVVERILTTNEQQRFHHFTSE
ncbi:TPA_asm: holo-ACP synthase, partial [Listeria monocytogenes]|nr:holo-ACP synthase [Listeria monocytogenes]